MKRYFLMTICGLWFLSFCEPANAQAPIPGQAYQIPNGFQGYGAGTLISYGGYNYVINPDLTTMVLANQAPDSSPPADSSSPDDSPPPTDDQGSGQAYQIPDGYAGYAAGTVISYGGSNYTIGSNGTMTLADQGAGQTYQVPDGYAGYAAGTVISYGGSNYTIGSNGTMTLIVSYTYSSNYIIPGGPKTSQNPGGVGNPGPQNGRYPTSPRQNFAPNSGGWRGAGQPGWNQGRVQNPSLHGGGWGAPSYRGPAQNFGRQGGGYAPAMNRQPQGGMGGGVRRRR
jgi:hypothetical protein